MVEAKVIKFFIIEKLNYIKLREPIGWCNRNVHIVDFTLIS